MLIFMEYDPNTRGVAMFRPKACLIFISVIISGLIRFSAGAALLQQDPDLTAAGAKCYGMVMGLVTETQDPFGERRVKIYLPWHDGITEGSWAHVSTLSAEGEGGVYAFPERNDVVWVTFEQGDIRNPVVTGNIAGYRDRSPSQKKAGMQIFCVMKAIVMDAAEPHEEDRICVKLPTINSTENGIWARVSALDMGESKGSFFRPEPDSEVWVTFEDGNWLKPIIIGSCLDIEERQPDVREVSLDEFMVRSGDALIINGEFWRRVESLENAGPEDRVYETIIDEDDNMIVRFGNGIRGKRPPGGSKNISADYRRGAGKNYPGVDMRKGRVAFDDDFNAASSGKYFGIYRGVVVNNADPMGLLRLKVNVPSVHPQNVSVWANPCKSASYQTIPSNGDMVWILFEEGAPDKPVWMGVIK
jgi:hypothetical protein